MIDWLCGFKYLYHCHPWVNKSPLCCKAKRAFFALCKATNNLTTQERSVEIKVYITKRIGGVCYGCENGTTSFWVEPANPPWRWWPASSASKWVGPAKARPNSVGTPWWMTSAGLGMQQKLTIFYSGAGAATKQIQDGPLMVKKMCGQIGHQNIEQHYRCTSEKRLNNRHLFVEIQK